MKPVVDQELCTGCELCVDTCPDVFEMNDEEKASARVVLVPAELEEQCREAADGCPVEAITLE
jgi:ferredoxin